MSDTVIPIWHSRSKNQNRFIEKGERLRIDVERVKGKKMQRIVVARQFYSYPSWEDVEVCRFTINRKVLEDLKKALEKMGESL